MTDRELLEYAAKAVGIEGRWMSKGDGDLWLYSNDFSDPWNPLTDDGDALRLAVRLQMDVCFNNQELGVTVWCEGKGDWLQEGLEDDPCAATRRAIVRAAAEIGRTMV